MPHSTAQLVAAALRSLGVIPDDPRQPAELTQNARTVLARRYLMKDDDHQPIEQPHDMYWRVADNLAQAELNYSADPDQVATVRQQFYDLLISQRFQPNSPTLMNAGRELQQLSACFVLPVSDTIEDIFAAVRSTAIIHKSGGGTGFDFSRLRPEGDRVRSTEGIASGPVSFIDAFDAATEVVKQGGTRRGANMGILRVDHPDVMQFIRRKADSNKLQNFNVSIAATDEFMQAVRDDRGYQLIHPNSKQPTGYLMAREVFHEITQCAWQTGDPGLVFIDAINRDNPNPHTNVIESTNPCVTGDTVVATTQGPRTAAELVGQPFVALVNGQEWPSTDQGFFPTGHRRVIRIRTDAGHRVTLTPDHKVRRREHDGDHWVTAGSIRPHDRLVTQSIPAATDAGLRHRSLLNLAKQRGAAVMEREITDTATNGTTVVTTCQPAGMADVYDCQIPGINAFDGNGLYMHQCGEQPLGPNESCNLGSINLARMVTYNHQAEAYEIDYDLLRETTELSVRLLDNVIDMNAWPLPEIQQASLASRRIGVGVMGFADLLCILGIPYASPVALDAGRRVMQAIHQYTWEASQQLAAERGTYPSYPGSKYETDGVPPMRNTAPVTIAPTGTISIIAGASSGIEPLFALAYQRNVMDNTKMVEFNYLFDAVAKHYGFDDPAVLDDVLQKGEAEHPAIPEWVQQLFQVSHQIPPAHHVAMQAAFQEFTDNAVSKTINLPNTATREQIADAYMQAWRTGCKGITVYRDGSKSQQVLSTNATPDAEAGPATLTREPRRRTMPGATIRINTAHGTTYVTVNSFDETHGVPTEVFANMGKAGSCDAAHIEAICRLASTAMRAGVPDEDIVDQLAGITCHPHWDQGLLIKSIPDAIAHAIKIYRGDSDLRLHDQTPTTGFIQGQQARLLMLPVADNPCPDCGAETQMSEGCRHCPQCGWNQCE